MTTKTLTTGLPTMQSLIEETEDSLRQNAFVVLMNQAPPEKWIKIRPYSNGVKYIPIERIEHLLSRIFLRWWVEIRTTQLIANSVVVTVRVYAIMPAWDENDERKESERTIWQDGIGAMPIQTEAGAKPMDFNAVTNAAVMMAAPGAETYAIKDAVEKWGKVFGKDLNRKEDMDYSIILKMQDTSTIEEKLEKVNTRAEYDLLWESLTKLEKSDIKIINIFKQSKWNQS